MIKVAGPLVVLTCLSVHLFSSPLPPTPNAAFEKLKILVGDWEGKTGSGTAVRVSYRLVSAGTTLMETLQSANEPDMVTVYHPDVNRVMLTHYCAANNQPRLRAEPIAEGAKQLTFTFVDVTNVATSTAGHMRQLVVTFEDKDHFTQSWTWREKERDQTEVFHFTRKQ